MASSSGGLASAGTGRGPGAGAGCPEPPLAAALLAAALPLAVVPAAGVLAPAAGVLAPAAEVPAVPAGLPAAEVLVGPPAVTVPLMALRPAAVLSAPSRSDRPRSASFCLISSTEAGPMWSMASSCCPVRETSSPTV